MTKFVFRWLINSVALYAAVSWVDGVNLVAEDWTAFIWLALIFGLLNAMVRPILAFLTCPLLVLTLGLGTLVLNTGMLYLTEWAAGLFNIGFSLGSFWQAFLGALVISAVSIVLSLVFKDELKGRRK